MKINNQSSSLIEQFWYDGLGERKSWKYDTNTDARVDGSDKKYHFAYDERWRLVMVFRESDTFPGLKEEHYFHAAGLDGQGRTSYIETEVLRDKDDNSGWTSAADGTLEQRCYYNQNWRAIITGSHQLIRVLFRINTRLSPNIRLVLFGDSTAHFGDFIHG